MTKKILIYTLFVILLSCATPSLENHIDTVIHEYSAHSTHAQAIPNLYELDAAKLWALLVEASEKGRYDEGLAISVRLLDFDANNDMIYHEMGYFLTQKGDLNAALAFYRKATQLNPENHASYYNSGEIYLHQHDVGQAQAMFKRAHSLDSDNDQYTIQLAKTYIMQRKYEQALELYLPLIKQIEDGSIDLNRLTDREYAMYADIYYDLALIYFYSRKDSATAMRLLETYDILKPGDEDAQRLLEEIHAKSRK